MFSLILSVAIFVFAFTSCSKKEDTALQEKYEANNPKEEEYIDKSPLGPKVRDNRIEPDLSKVEVMEPTAGEYTAENAEDFVNALKKFANPNGNKYDALAVLGDFGYDEKGDDLLKLFETASESWHATIIEKVGDKCVVEMVLKDEKEIELSDSAVAEWESINNQKCEAYSNIKCIIATNYSKKSVTLSLDLVKLNGNWHFASASSINRVLRIITEELL